MKTSLIIFGVIFLVLGVLLYLVPTQEVRADTTTSGAEGTDVYTSSARVTVPVVWAYASFAIGLILLLLGMTIPSQIKQVVVEKDSKNHSYHKIVDSKENTEFDNGNKRKVVLERTETHKSHIDDDKL